MVNFLSIPCTVRYKETHLAHLILGFWKLTLFSHQEAVAVFCGRNSIRPPPSVCHRITIQVSTADGQVQKK